MPAPGGLTVGEIVIYVAAVVSGLGVLWRFFVRRGWRAWRKTQAYAKKANEIVTRELTHNGGGSLKDVVHDMADTLTTLSDQMESATSAVGDNFRAVESLARVMDELVDRKQEDHDRLWEQIDRLWHEVISLGGQDHRNHPTT